MTVKEVVKLGFAAAWAIIGSLRARLRYDTAPTIVNHAKLRESAIRREAKIRAWNAAQDQMRTRKCKR